MNNSLDDLRRSLRRMGRLRGYGRWIAATSALIALVLWAMATIFVLDVLFEMDILQRATTYGLAAAGVMWAAARFVRPYLSGRESEIDLALLVEKHHNIDTDLVAAVEFASPEALSWGSSALRNAVIGDMVSRGATLNFSELTSFRDSNRRLAIAAITVVAWVSAAVAFPRHFSAFLDRLTLGDAHYPARTVIDSIEINGRTVLTSLDGATPGPTRCAERGAVQFVIRCSRKAPAAGELVLWETNRSAKRRIRLEPVRPDTLARDDRRSATTFVGRLPALMHSLEYQVYLGDAWTNPAALEMIALPEVEVECDVILPEYARTAGRDPEVQDTHALTVLEGAQVRLAVTCVNQKRLDSVWAVLRTASNASRHPLRPQKTNVERWQLAEEASTPLDTMLDDVQFEVLVTDTDRLQPLRVPTGTIRVQADLPPQGAAATIHRVVLPTAKPGIRYRVSDDFGVARLRFRIQVQRNQEIDRASKDGNRRQEVHWIEPGNIDLPKKSDALPLTGRFFCDLTPWKLVKGDQLKLTLETTDFRGSRPGQSALTEPLYLEVSDEAGVLAAILNADRQTEKDLDEIIDRQIESGNEP